MVGLLQHHVFHFHQPDLCASLIFIQLHCDIFDICLQIRDHHMLQRVNPATGFFNLSSHQLTGFFDLRQLEHIRKKDVYKRQAFVCRSPIVSVKGIFVIKNKKAWLSKKETVAHFCGTVSFVF